MENSRIEWCDHTFNPWMGCTKISPECEHCYAAELMDTRYGKVKWGPNGTRVITADDNWRKPLRWNREAAEAGRPTLVFCSSLADVFEDWSVALDDGPPAEKAMSDHKGNIGYIPESGVAEFGKMIPRGAQPLGMDAMRRRLFELIDATPHLRWLILTKRPENIRRMWPDVVSDSENWFFDPEEQKQRGLSSAGPHKGKLIVGNARRDNVWLGTSTGTQKTANRAIPELTRCRHLAQGLFLSCEPLLGPVDLHQWLHGINWVIVGGESGHHARPMHPDWARSIRDQATAAGVPFLFKQWGEWAMAGSRGEHCFNPGESIHEIVTMSRVGKKSAGRILDGREWLQFPAEFGRA